MNLMPLMAFEFMIQKGTVKTVPIRKPYNYNLALYVVIVTAVTIVLALVENLITKKVTNAIFSSRDSSRI
jgi:hypothetical protein